METIQTARPLRRNVKRNKGRITGTKRKTQDCATVPIADDFLNSRFFPMVMGKAYIKDWKETERDFLCSYHNFVAFYGLKPLDVQNKVYPYNICLAYQQVKAYMEQEHCCEDIMIANHEKSKCCIATAKCYDTKMTLYYIPLKPLYQLGQDKIKLQQYNLLLSVCTYLMKIVRIPSYQNGDYISSRHEILEEWMADDYGDLDAYGRDASQSEFREAEYFGAKMYKQMNHPYHLERWQHRLKSFVIREGLDVELLKVATEAHDLYIEFPKRTFYENIDPDFFMPHEEERTRADQYISFIWSESGWLYDQLFEMVNTDLQENGITDEPLFIRTFDTEGGTLVDDLDFEKRMFQLLNNLSDILYKISDEQHNTTFCTGVHSAKSAAHLSDTSRG